MNLMRPELHSFVAFASHVAVSVMFASAFGVLVLRMFRRTNAPARHAIALSLLIGVIVVPLMATAYQFQFVDSTSLPAMRRGLVTQEGTRPIQASNAEEASETNGGGGFRDDDSSRTAHWFLVTLATIWLFGAIGLTIVRFIAIWKQRTYLVHLSGVTNESILDTAGRLQQQMGIRRNVVLLKSRHTPWPFTVGIWSPKIILPMDLTKASESQRLEAALIHELAHISRGDYAVAMFESFVRNALWWNPFIHSIVTELNVAREQICDGFVLNHNGDGKSLAEYLISSMERAANARFSWGVGMSANEPHTVELRINRLMSGENEMIRISNYAKGPVLCCSIFLCVACVHVNYARAQFVLGTPFNFGPVVNTAADEGKPFLSNDGLTLYFQSNRPDDSGRADIWMSTRDSPVSEWSSPENFAEINTELGDLSPSISNDELNFFYTSGDPNNSTRSRILSLSREFADDAWGPPTAFPEPIYDAESNTYSPSVSDDGLSMLFMSDRENGLGQTDIWEASRLSNDDPWTVTNLGANVNSPARDDNPRLSPDGLTLVFGSDRPGGEGGLDLWMSTRESLTSDWRLPTNLGPIVNTAGNEQPSQWWEPGNMLLFKSGGGAVPGLAGEGGADMFYVNVVPEPSTSAMGMCGLLFAVGLVNNRRRKRA